MSYGELLQPKHYNKFPPKEEQDWSRPYATKLKLEDGKTSQIGLPDCAWTFPDTGEVLSQWADSKRKVELNLVIVSPDNGELPIRALSYTAGAMEAASALLAKGIQVRWLRMINPCYLNAYCDDGNLTNQLAHGGKFAETLAKFKERLTDLRGVEIKLDQGKPIIAVTDQAKKLGATLQTESLDILRERMNRHAQNPDEDKLTLYAWAHAPAWRYARDPQIFDNREDETSSVNYMPRSEMSFVNALSNAGIDVTPTATDTVSIFSNRIRHAPYLPIGSAPDEPRLAWNLSAADLSSINSQLSKNCGDPRRAEILSCTRHLQSFMQKISRR
jgi:hypothetical protein